MLLIRNTLYTIKRVLTSTLRFAIANKDKGITPRKKKASPGLRFKMGLKVNVLFWTYIKQSASLLASLHELRELGM